MHGERGSVDRESISPQLSVEHRGGVGWKNGGIHDTQALGIDQNQEKGNAFFNGNQSVNRTLLLKVSRELSMCTTYAMPWGNGGWKTGWMGLKQGPKQSGRHRDVGIFLQMSLRWYHAHHRDVPQGSHPPDRPGRRRARGFTRMKHCHSPQGLRQKARPRKHPHKN